MSDRKIVMRDFVPQDIDFHHKKVSDKDRKIIDKFRNFFNKHGVWGSENSNKFQDNEQIDEILKESSDYAEDSESIIDVSHEDTEYFDTGFDEDELDND